MSEVNLNDVVQETVRDSNVITVAIDTTLTHSGEAAEAKAVGDALALKADKTELPVAIQVNGQSADAQGLILVHAGQIDMSGTDSKKVAAKIAEIDAKTGADIYLNSSQGAKTIEQAINDSVVQTAATMPMSGTDSTTVAAKIAEVASAAQGAVKSVNSVQPDVNGDVSLDEVAFAQNLTSDQTQAVVDAFILRTTGGSRSVGSGPAQIQEIRGAMIHTGMVPEVLDWNTTGDISADIDRDVFIAVVTESTTMVLTYNGGWQLDSETVDPGDYGITVTGTPETNDEISITYVKEDRGTITPATPTAFKATGWNLFNPSVGYARVCNYGGAYHVGGTYSALKFSATVGGEQTALTVNNGSFSIPGDGYVWVTGGDATSTYITPEWTDWTNGPTVDFAAYSETTVSLAAIMTANFPNGLLAVGAIYDSISIDQGRAISRIERLDYDAETLADIIDEGRAYDADENYIYVVKTTPTSTTISISGQFAADDHGIEMFDGTEVATEAAILYGQNLKAKLISDVVTISKSELTDAQKAQVRENIGAEQAGVISGLLVVENKTVFDNKTINSGTFEDGTYSLTKTGYKPIAVAGYNFSNGSSSGSGRTWAMACKLYISGTNLTYSIRNLSNSNIKVKLNAYILYLKQ